MRYYIIFGITFILLLIILFYNPNSKYLGVYKDKITIEYNYNEIEGGIEMEEQKNIPDEYKPISMWGYFGYEILFSIPIKNNTLA